MAHKSVLQVLLAHAHAVEQHSRTSIVAPELRGILRETIAVTETDIDRDLLNQALDAAFEPRAAASNRIVAQAASAVTRSVGRLDMRAVADRHPLPALAPETTVQQVAGVAPRVDRLRGDIGMQVIGELFHRSELGRGLPQRRSR